MKIINRSKKKPTKQTWPSMPHSKQIRCQLKQIIKNRLEIVNGQQAGKQKQKATSNTFPTILLTQLIKVSCGMIVNVEERVRSESWFQFTSARMT